MLCNDKLEKQGVESLKRNAKTCIAQYAGMLANGYEQQYSFSALMTALFQRRRTGTSLKSIVTALSEIIDNQETEYSLDATTERESFEAEISKQYVGHTTFSRGDDGCYVDRDYELQWNAWCARGEYEQRKGVVR